MDKKKGAAAILGVAAGLTAARAIDLALIGGGVATAASAVAFAGYMTLSGDHEPYVIGMQHLAIFAQPSHRGYSSHEAANLDTNPIGAIPPEIKDKVAGYSLVGAQPGLAWLREGNRIFSVHPGDEPPRLGRVAAIERRDGRWALVDGKGATLIVSSLAELPDSTAGKFDKRMIFGDR
jgi:hypothetical protein